MRDEQEPDQSTSKGWIVWVLLLGAMLVGILLATKSNNESESEKPKPDNR